MQTALPAARLLPAQLLLLPPPVLPAVALHLLLLLAADLNCWASRRKADPRIELTQIDLRLVVLREQKVLISKHCSGVDQRSVTLQATQG